MSKEKDHFLNQEETIIEITQDENSIFRCLAHETVKEENLYEQVKTSISKFFVEHRNKLVPSVMDE